MGRIVAGVFVMFVTIAIISLCVVHDHEHKKVLVGTVGMIGIVIIYASPLSIIVSILYIALDLVNIGKFLRFFRRKIWRKYTL